MKSSKQSRRDAKQLLRSCQTNGLPDDGKLRQAVDLVIAQKPRGYAAILSHLHRLVKLHLDRRTVRVESALPLTPAEQSRILVNLTARYGAGLQISYAQNPALIGGMRIKVGSDVYDGSVQARLGALAESF